MKKLLCFMLVGLCLSVTGCSSSEEIKTTTCKLEQTTNGVKTNIEVGLEHSGDRVVKQKQQVTASTDNASTFELFEKSVKAQNLEEKTKGSKGVTYSLKSDKDNRSITERLEMDITKISDSDYTTLTGSNISFSKDKLSLKKTVDTWETQGYRCK